MLWSNTVSIPQIYYFVRFLRCTLCLEITQWRVDLGFPSSIFALLKLCVPLAFYGQLISTLPQSAKYRKINTAILHTRNTAILFSIHFASLLHSNHTLFSALHSFCKGSAVPLQCLCKDKIQSPAHSFPS